MSGFREERRREDSDDTSSVLSRGWWHGLLRRGGDRELEGKEELGVWVGCMSLRCPWDAQVELWSGNWYQSMAIREILGWREEGPIPWRGCLKWVRSLRKGVSRGQKHS